MERHGVSARGKLSPDYGWVIISEPYAPQVATVVEIDESGLTFISRSPLLREGDNLRLDLFFIDRDDFVLDLFCQVVSGGDDPDNGSSAGIHSRKWKVRFVDLEETRLVEIKSIIKKPVN